MKARSVHPRKLAAVLALLAGAVSGAEPDPCLAPALTPGVLQVWPLRERLAGGALGPDRTGIWNNFGEYQQYNTAPDYLHTGIDIRGIWTGEGDLTLVAADGDIWSVPQFTGDTCVFGDYCRVYIKSTDRRHIYYYSHLRIAGDVDSEVRARILAVANVPPANELPVGSNAVTAGQKLAALAAFGSGAFNHLHFAIFDACENYDGLHPLALLPPPQVAGGPYVDEEDPTIDQFVFLREDGSTVVNAEGCATPLSGVVDLVAEAKDTYRDLSAAPDSLSGTNSIGLYKASYRIRRTPSGPSREGTWYEFDRAPYRCRGSARGASCADPDPVKAAPIDQATFIQSVANLNGSGGADLGIGYTTTLYNTVPGSLKSSSAFQTNQERFVHLLTHEWALPDTPGRWDTADGSYPDGRYQVSVEVADQQGNKAAAHKFVLLDNDASPPTLTGELVVRDNPLDVGAVPSTLGGRKFWISPDIKVTEQSEPGPSGPTDPTWNTTGEVHLLAGTTYHVWVRVENTGCETLTGVRAKVAFANPQMIQTDWQQIDNEKGPVSLTDGQAAVLGPFIWTPTTSQEGHRCLLTIARAATDPPTVSDFGTIADGWGGTVASDNNIAQLNLQIGGTKAYSIVNPRVGAADVGVDFDCNDFPIAEGGSLAELVAAYHPALEAAWTDVPRTTLSRVGDQLRLRFRGCKVQLPAARLPGATVIPASFDLAVAPGPSRVFRLDLTQAIEGTVTGGMSFQIARIPPIH